MLSPDNFKCIKFCFFFKLNIISLIKLFGIVKNLFISIFDKAFCYVICKSCSIILFCSIEILLIFIFIKFVFFNKISIILILVICI